MKVLLVKVSALGDVVHALPVLSYLKSVDSEMSIDWLVEESFAPLLEGHPLIRKVHHLKTKAWRRQGIWQGLKGALEVTRLLRREKYDFALDLQGNCKSGLFTWSSKAPLRYGFERSGVREWPNLIATNRKVRISEKDYHISERSLAIARSAFPGGEDPPLAGPLVVDPALSAQVDKRLAQEGIGDGAVVVFHYGTTWKTKLWPLDCWQNLAEKICREDGLRPVLTWGNDEEKEVVQAIKESTGGQAVIWSRGSLPELVALLKRADLVVGGDTGPIHIAAAVDTPTVSLFRVTDARRNGPRGAKHCRLQAPMDCSPCLLKSCDRDEECGHSLSSENVLQAIRSLLNRCF